MSHPIFAVLLVLALLPKSGSIFQCKFSGPYKILNKKGDLKYQTETANWGKKSKWVHINHLKRLHAGDNPITTISKPLAEHLIIEKPISPKCNSDILENLGDHSPHLGAAELDEIRCLLHEFLEVISDTPGLTNVIEHDVELIDERPIKQYPYHLNPLKAEVVKKEINYMLNNNLFVKSKS